MGLLSEGLVIAHGRAVFFCIPKAGSVSIRRVIGETPATPEQVENGHRVAFVRHPLARLHSCWKHWVRDAHHHRMAIHGITAGMAFDAFVRRVAEVRDSKADIHFASQSFLLYREPHFVGHVERFAEDWARLGLPPIGHHHERPGAWPYGRETARIASERYAQDMERFGYEIPIHG